MSEQGGLPAVPETHRGSGFTLNVAGIPIPLRRTFGALDRLIAIPIEALADAMESKIRGNLDSHVEAVRTNRSKKGKKTKIDDPSVKTTRAIADWASSAAAVEQGDKELSALWRSILDKIMENEDDGEDLLRVVQGLSTADLRYFLNRFAGKWTMRTLSKTAPEGAIERLHSAGLITRPISLPFLFGATVAGLLLIGVSRPYASLLPNALLSILAQSFGLLGGSVAVVLAAVLLLIALKYSPTQAGNRLCDLYKEYVRVD